jgi:hypothetical protein
VSCGSDRSASPGRIDGNDDVGAGFYQFCGERRESLVFRVRGTNEETHTPSVLVAKLAQGFEEEWVGGVLTVRSKDGDRRHTWRGRVRSGGEHQNGEDGT